MGSFVKAGTKKSLLALVKKGELNPRFWSRFFEAFVTKDELGEFATNGDIDHGNTSGKGDDDHTQYLLASQAGSRALFTTNWTDLTDAGETALHIHDDRYYTETETDAKYLPLTAGITKPLTDYLYITKSTASGLILGISGAILETANLLTTGAETTLTGQSNLGSVSMGFKLNPGPLAGPTGDATFHFAPTTQTSGTVKTVFYDGATPAVQHEINQTSGDVGLCKLAGELTVGSTAGNGVLIDPANGIYLYGSAIAWDDLRVPVNATKLGGAKDPAFSVFMDNGAGSQGVFLYWFSASQEQEVFFAAQLPHGWAEGTDIEAHVHWTPSATEAGAGTDVSWGLEYTWANINGTFGNTAIIYGDEQTNGAAETITVDKHYITELGTISSAGKTISSMLVCRLFRDATGAGGTDDYTGTAGLLEVDFHHQINSLGSDDEYVKGP